MNVLITGASGFTGLKFVDFLLNKNCKVFNIGRNKVDGVTNFIYDDNFSYENISDIINEVNPNFLFHIAGCAYSNNILDYYKINCLYASYILDAIENNRLDDSTRIMFIGTAAEYGYISKEVLPINESHLCNPISHYGISKFSQTKMAISWSTAKKYRKVCVVRPFNLLGKGMPSHLAIGSFANQIKNLNNKGQLKVGNLNVKRDFISIDDAVNIYWKLINDDRSFNKIFNVCSGQSTNLKEMVDYLIKVSGKSIDILFEKKRLKSHDMKDHYGNNRKLLSIIGEYDFIDWKSEISKIFN